MPTFTHDIHTNLPTLVIAGEVDLTNQAEFREALSSLDATLPCVMLDFCRCEYFDSSAIAEMMKFYRERSNYQQIMLLSPAAGVRRVLSITGLDRIFPIGECIHSVRHRLAGDRDELRMRRLRRIRGLIR